MKAEILPIGLKLQGRLCLVVGHGAEAWPRTKALLDAGARVRVVSESPAADLVEAHARGDLSLETRAFTETDLDDVWVAVLTDFDAALAARMAEASESRRVFFCAVDQPTHSSYSHLAIARRDSVTIAISTSGRAPALARRLREEMDRVLSDADIAGFVSYLKELRARTASDDRRKVLGDAVSGVRIDGKLVLPENR